MPGSSPDAADVSAEAEILGSTDTAAAAPAETQGADVKPESSPAPAGTMLDAVQAALEPKAASPAPQEPGQADDADPDKKPADGEAEDSQELSPEELKALSWKTQQRFKTLSSKVKATTVEVEALKPKAEEYDRMVGAIRRAGIDNRELDELVEVGGMLKSNPRAAYEKIMPIIRALENVIGEVLPPELQEQVRLGYLTEDHARELNRSRAGERLATHRSQQTEAQQKAEREEREQRTLIESSIKAAESWDAKKAEKDPDWHLKRKEVAEQVELAIVRESNKRGAPYFPTAEEAVKLAEDALKTVEDRLKRFKPKPAEIRLSTPGASTRTKPAPKSTLEAINNALG